MLTLALAMLAAPLPQERASRTPTTPTSVSAAVADATRPDCTLTPLAVGCPDRSYRLDPSINAAERGPEAVPDESWRRCGLMGMPVCPGKGTTIVRSSDEPTTADGPDESE